MTDAPHPTPTTDRAPRHGADAARDAPWTPCAREVAKAVVGQDAAVSGLLVALLDPRPRADGGRARRRQDPAGAQPGRGARRRAPSGCSSPPT